MLVLLLISCTLQAQTITKGKASYYANKFHGRTTSSGDMYHRDSLTCAHRTLPFGTKLKVRNPRNNQEVVVEVNDRGPFCEGRVVDLSYAAAKQIGILHRGVARVEIEEVLPFSLQKTEEFALPELFVTHPITRETHTFEQWAQNNRQQTNNTWRTNNHGKKNKQLAQHVAPLRWHVDAQKSIAQAKNTKHNKK